MSIEPNLIRSLKDASRNRDIPNAIGLLQRKFGLNITMLMLTRPNLSNQELWSIIQNTPTPTGIRAYGQESERAISRANDIRDLVYLFPPIPDPIYLDVGSNTGEIAYAVAQDLGIGLTRTYGLDEGEFAGMIIERTAPINHITYTAQGKIPLQDGSIDLITILQTLHHIQDLGSFMRELRRVTKVGGLVIVREHDMINPSFKYVIDLEHMIWSAKEEKPNNTYHNFVTNYYGRYFSSQELTNLFNLYGFEPISLPRKYGSPFGATRYYYATFRKKDVQRRPLTYRS